MSLIIVGLGPGRPELLTREADRVLRSAGRVYMRTGRHPCADYLVEAGVSVETFDDVYESNETMADVHEEIAERVVSLDSGDGPEVVFAVPGHPLVGETAVTLILARSRREGIPVQVIDGLSFIEPAAAALEIDPLQGIQIVDGLDLTLRPFPAIETDCGVLVGQLCNRQVAGDIKLTLSELYPDDHEVMLVQAPGTVDTHVQSLPLFELDRQPGIDHLSVLYVPPLPRSGSWFGLQSIVAQLRAPGGCPWDREQTHRTLRTHLLDETYEVLDALDRDDTDDLCVELGDLALQIVLHIQIAREEGEFRPTDVFAGIIAKLRRRHPHVFGDAQVNGAGEVMTNWEHIKRAEKGARDNSHQLDGVPATLPALSQALTYQERAARIGYEAAGGDSLEHLMARWMDGPDSDMAEKVLGDLIFALVSSARDRGLALNPENALREANSRFAAHFKSDQRAE